MRVRMLVDISGDRNGRPWPRRGQEHDVPDGEGADLCAAGLAEPVVADPVETATLPDTSAKRRTRTPAKTGNQAGRATKSGPADPAKPGGSG